MADRHEHAADDDGAALAEQAVGNQPAQDRREIGEPGVEPEQMRGERLRLEPAEQEFERGLDRGKSDHAFDPAGLEQVLDHVEDDQRGIAEIGEAFPGLGREQHREPARVAEEIAWLRRRSDRLLRFEDLFGDCAANSIGLPSPLRVREGGGRSPRRAPRPCYRFRTEGGAISGEGTGAAAAARAALAGGALAQQRDETVLRHRLAEQEALADVAAHAGEGKRVRGLLDADGDRRAAEIMREIDHSLAERSIDLVGAAIADESAVELELGERQLLEPGEGGIAAAEIVDRELNVDSARRLVMAAANARSVTICSSVTSMINPGQLSVCRDGCGRYRGLTA